MDLKSLIELVIAIVVVYFFIKFIVSPVAKAIFGVIAFIILIYILQKYLGFDLGKVLSPFGISFDSSTLNSSLNWLFNPVNYLIGKATSIFQALWKNVPSVNN